MWRRVGGRAGLDSRGLAVLRELAVWRDQEARRRNKPRRTVMKDDALVEIARRVPRSASAVLALRGIPPNLGERSAESIAERVGQGLAVPERDRPRIEFAPPLDEQGAALVELLSAVVRARALEENLPPSLLANQEDLRALAARRHFSSRDALESASPLFSGWRGELIGDILRDVLAGRLGVRWDAEKGRLTLSSF